MQKAIAQKDARAVAALNAMALEVANIKERIGTLAATLHGPNSSQGPDSSNDAHSQTLGAGTATVSAPSPLDAPGNYTGRPIRGYKLSGVPISVRTYKDLLISLSNTLRKKHPNFDQCAIQLGGRKRRYFSRRQQDLKYAHELDGGGLFLETNLNANLIVNNICIPLLRQLEPGVEFNIQ